tara:strand:+ start:68 stop:325 length:258 start_codon:yes stop_codon:yes gene_type:complete
MLELIMSLSDLHLAQDQWILDAANDLDGNISGRVFGVDDIEIGEEYCFNLYDDELPTLRFIGMVIEVLDNRSYAFMNTQEVTQSR